MLASLRVVGGIDGRLGSLELESSLVGGLGGEVESRLEEAQRLGGGADAAGPEGGALEVVPGLAPELRDVRVAGRGRVHRVEQVLGDEHRELVAAVGQRDQVRGRRQVPGLAVASGLRGVGDLADHRLHEPVLPAFGAEPVDLERHDLLAHQRAQHRLEGGGVAAQRHQAVAGERRAEHAGVGDDPLLLGGERVETGGDQRLQRGRGADGREVQVRAVRRARTRRRSR